jgi:hypothetical protein
MTFDQFFEAATRHAPYDYQRRLAVGDAGHRCESQLINVPAGLGKTAAVVLAWLWNRVAPSLEFSHQYDTVFSRTQCLGEFESAPGGIKTSVRDQTFVHDSRPQLRRAFRPGGDAPDHQWFVRQYHPNGPRLYFRRRRPRLSARPGDHRAPSRPDRAPLASKSARGHFEVFKPRAACHQQLSCAQRPRRIRCPRGADLLVCQFEGPPAPRGAGDSANRQVGDLPHLNASHLSALVP